MLNDQKDKLCNSLEVSNRTNQFQTQVVTENVPDGCETRSCHESMRLNVEDETLRDRTEQPVVNCDESSHEQTMLNEVNMDFKIPGLPHSVVKHAQRTSVRELIQKIENHPNRHALQRDLQQSQSFNPFSPESKQMIHEVGNIELCELLETEPKTQRTVCLSYWDIGILCCTCGHFLHKGTGEIRNSSSVRWTFFQFRSTSSRKDDLTDIDMVRSRETRNILRPTS